MAIHTMRSIQLTTRILVVTLHRRRKILKVGRKERGVWVFTEEEAAELMKPMKGGRKEGKWHS